MRKLINRPASLGCFGFFIAGAILSYQSPSFLRVFTGIALVLPILAVVLCICKRFNPAFRAKGLALISLTVGLALAGIISAFVFIPSSDLPKGEVSLHGTVSEKVWGSDSYCAYKVRIDDQPGGLCALGICTDPSLEPGDVISATGEFSTFEQAGVGDMERYLSSEGIRTCVTFSTVSLVGEKSDLSTEIAKLRGIIAGKMSVFLEGDGAGLAVSLVTGDRSGLDGGVTLDFQRLGISHLLAISGIHMSVVFSALSVILTFTPLGKRRGAVILIPFILFYMGISGFSASVVRAGTMLILGCILQTFGRRRDPFSFLGVCAAGIALFDPYVFYSTGFLLSVVSVMGVLWFGALTEKRREEDVPSIRRVLYFVLSTVGVTVAASLFTMPVIAAEFGQMSAVSPLANLVFIPLVTGLLYILPLFVLSLLTPSLAEFIGGAVSSYATFILRLAEDSAAAPSLTFSVEYPFFLPLSFAAVAGAMMLLLFRKKKIGAVVLALSCMGCVSSAVIYEAGRSGTVTVTPLSDSGGDLIGVTSGSEFMLVDMTGGGYSMISQGIEFANESCITEIDHYVLTHYHSRHVSSVKTLLDRVYVKTVWLPEPMDKAETEIAMSIAEAGVRVELIGEEILFGDALYTPGERCWLSRSAEAVYSASISAFGKSVVYLSPGYFEVGRDFRALGGHDGADWTVYGSHGAKYKEDMPSKEDGVGLIFLGNSAEFYPAEDALRFIESDGIVANAGYTIRWED